MRVLLFVDDRLFAYVILKDFLLLRIVFEVLLQRLIAHYLLLKFNQFFIKHFFVRQLSHDVFHARFHSFDLVPNYRQESQHVGAIVQLDHFLLDFLQILLFLLLLWRLKVYHGAIFVFDLLRGFAILFVALG